jgi:hypothetical protein
MPRSGTNPTRRCGRDGARTRTRVGPRRVRCGVDLFSRTSVRTGDSRRATGSSISSPSFLSATGSRRFAIRISVGTMRRSPPRGEVLPSRAGTPGSSPPSRDVVQQQIAWKKRENCSKNSSSYRGAATFQRRRSPSHTLDLASRIAPFNGWLEPIMTARLDSSSSLRIPFSIPSDRILASRTCSAASGWRASL